METEWKPTGHGNYLLVCDGFELSYNPDVSLGLAGFFDALMGYDQHEETAILIGGEDYVLKGKCYILNGDHREQLAELAAEKGLAAVLDYFRARPQEWGPTSDQPDEIH